MAPIYVADMRDTTIKGNSFNDCLRGVVFNAGGQYPITNVTVEDNIFRHEALRFPAVRTEPRHRPELPDRQRLALSSRDQQPVGAGTMRFIDATSSSDEVIALSIVQGATIDEQPDERYPRCGVGPFQQSMGYV